MLILRLLSFKEEGICFLHLSYLLVSVSWSWWFDLNSITFGSPLNSVLTTLLGQLFCLNLLFFLTFPHLTL